VYVEYRKVYNVYMCVCLYIHIKFRVSVQIAARENYGEVVRIAGTNVAGNELRLVDT